MIIDNRSEKQIAIDAAVSYLKKADLNNHPNSTELKNAYIQGRLDAIADWQQLADAYNKINNELYELKHNKKLDESKPKPYPS